MTTDGEGAQQPGTGGSARSETGTDDFQRLGGLLGGGDMADFFGLLLLCSRFRSAELFFGFLLDRWLLRSGDGPLRRPASRLSAGCWLALRFCMASKTCTARAAPSSAAELTARTAVAAPTLAAERAARVASVALTEATERAVRAT